MPDTSFMHAVDPFSTERHNWFWHVLNAFSATAVVRCWPLLLFFTGWATAICCICHFVHDVGIQSTLLTVIGTVLGFVVSYRTTSSFERYNEGRKLWSQIVLASRTFARTVWFNVPEMMPATAADEKVSAEQRKQRVLIEKKTAINLVEAFAVAVKHYLRGEDGVYYVDLYHLVKFLPSYALPTGLPSALDLSDADATARNSETGLDTTMADVTSLRSPASHAAPRGGLPVPATAKPAKATAFLDLRTTKTRDTEKVSAYAAANEEGFLLPARNPPQLHLWDVFPFSLLVHRLTQAGKDVKGRRAARLRARMQRETKVHNMPLEISLYLSSYVAALQARKAVDPPTATALLNSLNLLVDALTGLERILTTPIPFSYRVHLWSVTTLYNFFLPFQIWGPLGWLTIPATALLSFIFFGFLSLGEEIENPFGYDKNDLNMDHFTHTIIRNELRALTALPVPDPSVWAFSSLNDMLVADHMRSDSERVPPAEWMSRGLTRMQEALSVV